MLIASIVMKRGVSFIVLLAICMAARSQPVSKKVNWTIIVDDDTTAIKIAEAIWIPKIGSEAYNPKRPYKAVLVDDSVWIVHGTIGAASKGGSPTTYIQKKDGKVVGMMQGK